MRNRNIKILIFGASEAGKKALTNISTKVEVLGFLDNDPGKWNTSFDNKPIYSPQNLNNLEYDFIIIASMYVSQIYDQLIVIGIDRGKVITSIDENPNEEPFPWDTVLFILGISISIIFAIILLLF